jgi:hypothetical protein
MMASLIRLGELSIALKMAWAVWLTAGLSVVIWRRRGRIEQMSRPPVVRPVHSEREEAKPSKRRWRLRAAPDAVGLQLSSSSGS